MSRSTQKDLQNPSADVAISKPPPDMIIIERTARLVSKMGLEMERKIMGCNEKNKKFNFLRRSDPYHQLYQLKLTEYQEGSAQSGAHESIRVGLAPPFKDLSEPLVPLSFSLKPPEGMTHIELGIIKLTAQFVARYGMYLLADLMKRLIMNPQFEFMKETDSRRYYFTQLVAAYSRVLEPSTKLKERGACMKIVLKGFFYHLQLIEKLEDAFVDGVNYFACLENGESSANVPPPKHLSPQMQPGMPVTPPLFPANHLNKLSSSTQDDLQSGQNISNQAQADLTIIELHPAIKINAERTAVLVSQEGLEIERMIRDCNVGDKLFNFLRSSDPCHSFYQQKLTEYRQCLGNALPDHRAPRYRDPPEPPIAHSFALTNSPEGITLKELGIMKLAAQFVVRYEMYFFAELVKRVTQFKFMDESDTRMDFFTKLVRAYSSVLMPSLKMMSKWDACTEAVFKGFLEFLELDDENKVHAFVGGIELFALLEDDVDVEMMRPRPEEPEPKRQKLDESDLLPGADNVFSHS